MLEPVINFSSLFIALLLVLNHFPSAAVHWGKPRRPLCHGLWAPDALSLQIRRWIIDIRDTRDTIWATLVFHDINYLVH